MMAGVHFLYSCTFAIVTCFCYATADEGVGIPVKLGGKVTLKCDIRNVPSDKWVLWFKETPYAYEDDLISLGEFTFTADTRFSVDAKDNHAIDLIIMDAKESDEGMYQCRVSIQKETVVLASYNLEVKEE